MESNVDGHATRGGKSPYPGLARRGAAENSHRQAGGGPKNRRDMGPLDHLFEQNRTWAETISARDPDFFLKLSRQQSPEYLWIGCSDSRVPANEIVNLPPGEIFVHRNIANVVVHTDLNCLSVLQFAIDVLKVKHVIVCGHYGCSGVRATLRCDRIGLADNWLRHVQDVMEKHHNCVSAVPGENRSDQPPLRTQRDRTGGQRLPDDDRPRCLGPGPSGHGARLDLRPERRADSQSGAERLVRPGIRPSVPGGVGRGRRRRAVDGAGLSRDRSAVPQGRSPAEQ